MKKIFLILGSIILCFLIYFLSNLNIKRYYIIVNEEKIKTNYKDLVQEDSINIREEGTYYIKGNSNNYKVNIKTKGKVKIVLKDVKLKNKNNLINIQESDEIILKLKGDNELTSEENIVIKGSSKLIIEGNGNLQVNGSQGINIENDVTILNNNITIDTIRDAISAKKISIENSIVNIWTKGNYVLDFKNGRYEFKNDEYYKVPKSDMDKYSELYSLENSCKGLYAENEINILNSTLIINTTDDCLNSKGNINSKSCIMNLTTSDDAITSDKEININESEIQVEKSFEGIESKKIELNDNKINIIAYNDGINIKEKGTDLIIKNCNLNINVKGDGLDIGGKIFIYDSFIEVQSEDDAIQAKEFLLEGGTVKAYTSGEDNLALVTKIMGMNGEILLGQKSKDCMFYQGNLKLTYVNIEKIGKFKIINKNKDEIIVNEKEDCNYYMYINNNVSLTEEYYLLYNEEEKIIKFK